MQNNKNSLLLAIIVLCAANTQIYPASDNGILQQLHQDMQSNFNKLHQEIQQMQQEIPTFSLSIDKSHSTEVRVIIEGIKSYDGKVTKQYDDKKRCDGVDITTDSTTIQLVYMADSRYLEVNLTYQINTKEEQNKSGLQKMTYHKTIEQGVTLNRALDLENIEITFNEKELKLIITVPKIMNEEDFATISYDG